MFLHHIVTLFLYGFSYLTNLTLAGAVIMFLHDWADIFTQFVRCFSETTFLPLALISTLGMTLSWFYTRIYVFPFIIYEQCLQPDLDIFEGKPFFTLKFMGYLLGILFILHVYWFFVLLRCIHKFMTDGKVVDYQQKIR